jgi:hypothetical protein
MPNRLFQHCRENGCCNRTNTRSGYCADHEKDNTALDRRKQHDAERRNDPVSKMYHTPEWPAFRIFIFNRNQICQRIGSDGMQCRFPSTILHHLISPRVKPELFLDPHNVVALCEHCHPPDEGTPDWIAGRDFVVSIIEPPTCV